MRALIQAIIGLFTKSGPIPPRPKDPPVRVLGPKEIQWKLTGWLEHQKIECPLGTFEEALRALVTTIPQGRAGYLFAVTPIGTTGFSASRGKKKLGFMKTGSRRRLLSVAVMDSLGLKDGDELVVDGVPWTLRTKGVSLLKYSERSPITLYDPVSGRGTPEFHLALAHQDDEDDD